MTKNIAETRTAALYVAATPLGNRADITHRVIEVLQDVDAIACEDTRHTRHLLDQYGIRTPTFALHEHNEAAAAQKLVSKLAAGQRIALVSDAGTPAISDPGARAVAAVRAAGFPVIPLPGPNAAITALSASGLDDTQFLFVGFLPNKSTARRQKIEALRSIDATLVFYEAPHRILEMVSDLAELLEPQRTLVIARELTKLFEQIVSMPLKDSPDWLRAEANHQRGEFVVLVGAAPPKPGLSPDTLHTLKQLLAELPLKQAVKLAVEITGAPKNELYEIALTLKDEGL